MTPSGDFPNTPAPPADALPLSLLNDYLYCPRRAALKIVEGWREANAHTERGDIVHEHADLRGFEVVQGVTLLRALPVFSDRLGLNGKCDIVEVHPPAVTGVAQGASPGPPAAQTPSQAAGAGPASILVPVEFKLGRRRKWDNDDVQVCAQALCLEEMFGTTIPRGAIYHADSKRRRDVEFTPALRLQTAQAVAALHALARAAEPAVPSGDMPPLPAAEFRPACEQCSLYTICLPRATGPDSRAARLARELFQCEGAPVEQPPS